MSALRGIQHLPGAGLSHSVNGWEQPAGSAASTNTAMDFKAVLGQLKSMIVSIVGSLS